MSSTQFPKRSPAIQCWIKHLIEAKYSKEEKSLYTIFGKIKRARIVGTLIDKRELIAGQFADGEGSYDSVSDSDLRIEFDLDDTTGIIRATLWQADPEKYSEFNIGDIVDIVGLIRKWKDFVYISPEIMKKVNNPNFVLLRNAEIIKTIQSGETQEIPEFSADDLENNEVPSEIDVDALFEEKDDLKMNIYSVIKNSSDKGPGIKFEDLLKKIDSSEEELKKNIKILEKESKIYLSEDNYHSF